VSALFITLEGIEGSGKTTHLPFVADWLRQHKRQVVITREPGGTPLGEQVRGILLDNRHQGMGADAELLLIFAARAEHLHQVVEPALAKGSDVVCDRFTDATYAYQGGGRGLPVARIAQLEQMVQGDLRPHFTLLFDVPLELAVERRRKRGQPDRFESEQLAFHRRVQDTYRTRAAAEPRRFLIVDSSGTMETTQALLARQLAERVRC
jgi:dTMP kinase